MALEDDYPEVLHNIEFAIVSVYREQSDLHDFTVIRALDALIDVYRAEFRGHTPKIIHLPEPENLIFQRIQTMCEISLGRSNEAPALRGDVKTVDVILACVRKIRKSVDRWNKRGGQQGYLQFVCQYVG
jgi:hypothetical protein